MNKILIILSILFISCGGSRKPKTCEYIVISKIVANTYNHDKSDNNLYCKYLDKDKVFYRRFKFVDTCGKFKIGDTVWVNFYKR
jgi:hypothetical protein